MEMRSGPCQPLEEIGHGGGPGIRGPDGLLAVALGTAELGDELLAGLGPLERGLGGGVGDIEFISNAGAAAESVLYCAPWVPSYGGAVEEAQTLAGQFKEKYGYEMTMEPCWGWLGMATIINAIEGAGSSDREAVADALYSMDVDDTDWALWFSGYEGVKFCTEGQTSPGYGSDSGERYNQNVSLGEMGGMVMVQVQDGEWTIVYPTTYTDGKDIINY